MVKLRLRRMGAINKPFYRIVAVDSRKKRDGKYLESVGYYDPKTDPFTLKVDIDKCIEWLKVGAQPSETVRSLLKNAGVLEKWHNIRMGIKEDAEPVKETAPEPVKETAPEPEPEVEVKEEPAKEEVKKAAKKATKKADKADKTEKPEETEEKPEVKTVEAEVVDAEPETEEKAE